MIDDPELAALNTAYTALKDLDPDAVARNLNWIATRLGVAVPLKPAVGSTAKAGLPGSLSQTQTPAAPERDTAPSEQRTDPTEFFNSPTAAEFLARFHNPSDKERVLIVAAYLQKSRQTKDLTGFLINKELKNIGHGLKNITAVTTQWQQDRPQKLIQLRKSGSSQQAQKTLKVTEEGLKWVVQRASLQANED